MAAVEMTVPDEPNLLIAIGLAIILVLVLILPFRVKRVEENLEPFFLIMGIAAVTISGLWSLNLIIEAIEAPVKIAEVYGIPIGIFQVVLIVGLIIHYFHRPIYSALLSLMKKIGVRTFAFIFVVLFGLASSLISVIVCAVLLAEIALVMPLERKKKIEFIVIACFAVGFGAALTPVGEPLSTIAVKKLAGEPYHADFFFLFKILAHYIIPAVIALGIYAAFRVGKQSVENLTLPEYTETLRGVIIRALKVYTFVAALILLGGGFTPLIVWYISKIPPEILYWVNIVSAVLDNATLTAAEIGPVLTLTQIQSALIALLIAGGMLIPGNIPNIVSAARMKITSSEWARVGVPLGLFLMCIYYVLIFFLGL